MTANRCIRMRWTGTVLLALSCFALSLGACVEESVVHLDLPEDDTRVDVRAPLDDPPTPDGVGEASDVDDVDAPEEPTPPVEPPPEPDPEEPPPEGPDTEEPQEPEPDPVVPTDPPDPDVCEVVDGRGLDLFRMGLSVEAAVSSSCTTAIVAGLSQQLIDEINCMEPGTMRSMTGIQRLSLRSVVFPWLQAPAADALERATAAGSGTMTITSALRTLPQQYLLYRWAQAGRCGIRIAAAPGRSNHNGGLAIDTVDWSAWRTTLSGQSWQWFGAGDEVHFDYVGAGTRDLRQLSVLAFQRLWNRNHPNDRIAEDGLYGPITESRLRQSPADGFAIGAAGCATEPAPMEPVALDWWRESDGTWTFTAEAPASVARVEYFIDDYPIAGAHREDSTDFRGSYRFSVERAERVVEARGFAADGTQVARGTGLIDVVPGTGVFLRQRGEQTWALGLERAPNCLERIEVRVDDLPLGEAVAVEGTALMEWTFSQLGERVLRIDAWTDDDTYLGSLLREIRLESP